MTNQIHIVGAGLAGLSCAVRLAQQGHRVICHEAAGQAGGRCRSFHDTTLDRQIDNGNHLMFSANHGLLEYLEVIGSNDSLTGPQPAEIKFLDLEDGARWTLRPNSGLVPWWIFSASRRVAGTTAVDYLSVLRVLFAGRKRTIADCFNTQSTLYRRLWEPLATSALNTEPETAAASLLWPVIRETFAMGEAASRPLYAKVSLADSLITPAIDFIGRSGGEIRFNNRLRQVDYEDNKITELHFTDGICEIDSTDKVVLALPPAGLAELLPGQIVPKGSQAIVNGHFRLADPVAEDSFLGLVGGTAHWLFLRGDIASVTVSAADKLAELDARQIAALLWRDIAMAMGLDDSSIPPFRIIKEKRATFAQTVDQIGHRPGAATRWKNLALAGDWTDTGLPATIEGAIRSGNAAASRILSAGQSHQHS